MEVTLNNFDMHYEIQGEGPPLLMLHGFTGSGAGLIAGFNQLSKTYQLIVPDLRGHGRSTNPSKQFTFQQAALDVFALLEHLNISECNAVGFSGGGCTLLKMAYQQPEKFKSMVIISATPYFPESTRELMRQFTVETRTQENWDAMRQMHVHGDEQIKLIWEQANVFSESYDDMNFTPEQLSQIKTKTLIVQGDRDHLYPLELSVELYKNMPNAQLWIVPNGGHVPITGKVAEEFMDYLVTFLEG